jgi:hypothetical protein
LIVVGAVGAAVIGFTVSFWNQKEEVAGIEIARQAAVGCGLRADTISTMVSHYHDENAVGWAESGDQIAKELKTYCESKRP